MKPSIHLLFHPGMGKTATTWTQTVVLPQLASVLSLGKGSGGTQPGDESSISTDLTNLQYLIFSPIVNKSSLFERYRNSFRDVMSYSDLFVDLIEQHIPQNDDGTPRTSKVVVISDETITGYCGVQVNLGILSALIDCIEDRLRMQYNVQSHIVMTIREQSSLIQSLYAYQYDEQYSRYGSLGHYIEYGLNNSQHDIFGQIFYDELYGIMRHALDDSVSLRFVPYEMIAASGPLSFLKEYFHFLDEDHPVIRELELVEQADYQTKVNVNSVMEHGSRKNTARTRGDLVRVVDKIAANTADLHRRSPLFRVLVSPIKKILLVSHNRFMDLSGGLSASRRIRVTLTSEEKRNIHQLYADSNLRCGKLLGLQLRELGYPYPEQI